MPREDLLQLVNKLWPQAGGEDVVRWRTGVVDAVNSDGTYDVAVSGVVIPDMFALQSVTAAPGDTVHIVVYRGMMIIVGGLAVTSARATQRLATNTRTSNSSGIGTTETQIDTVVAALVSGRVYRITWDVGYTLSAVTSGDHYFLRVREDNVSGTALQGGRVSEMTTAQGYRTHIAGEYTAASTGNKTFSATTQRTGAGGTITVQASAVNPTYLYVDYIRG